MPVRPWPALAMSALLAAVGPGGAAMADPPPRETVVAMLSTIEEGPGADAWRRLGPETLGVLVDLYGDGAQPRFVRRRAVAAAAYFPGPAAKTFLLAVARAPGQHDLTARTAILALGRAFGHRVVPELAGFLSHADPDVREGAVIALVRVNTPRARAALDAHRTAEDRGYIAERIDRCLARPAAPAPAGDPGTTPDATAPGAGAPPGDVAPR